VSGPVQTLDQWLSELEADIQMDNVFRLVREERRQQDAKWGPSNRILVGTPEEQLAILVEEVGEVAKAVVERDAEETENELIQVAAVAVAWLESILTRKARG
jgi:NTP pyrophosphatase (non-canonical NTP hydrolase)